MREASLTNRVNQENSSSSHKQSWVWTGPHRPCYLDSAGCWSLAWVERRGLHRWFVAVRLHQREYPWHHHGRWANRSRGIHTHPQPLSQESDEECRLPQSGIPLHCPGRPNHCCLPVSDQDLAPTCLCSLNPHLANIMTLIAMQITFPSFMQTGFLLLLRRRSLSTLCRRHHRLPSTATKVKASAREMVENEG